MSLVKSTQEIVENRLAAKHVFGNIFLCCFKSEMKGEYVLEMLFDKIPIIQLSLHKFPSRNENRTK